MVPRRYRVQSITQETNDTFTLDLSPLEGEIPPFFPGQFNMLYLFGYGEVPISISSAPSQKNLLSHTIRAVGPITQAMQQLQVEDEIGIRGPFGSSWPLAQKGDHLFLIAGGLGLSPLRPCILHVLANKDHYKHVTLLYGARTPEDIIYKDEMEKWKAEGIDVQISVDKAESSWHGHVGVITRLISRYLIDPKQTRVLLCGPEIMMKFALQEIMALDVVKEEIFLAMERNMKCAVGFCGHCQYGPYFICKDGPILAFDQIKNLFSIKEL